MLDIWSTTNDAISTGPHNDARQMYVLPLKLGIHITLIACMYSDVVIYNNAPPLGDIEK